MLLEDQRCSRLAFNALGGHLQHRGAGTLLDLLRRRRRAAGLQQRARAHGRDETRTSTRHGSFAHATPSTSTRPRRRRPRSRRWCAGCSRRSAVRPTRPTPPASSPVGCCSLWMRSRTSHRWRSCRRSHQKAAAKDYCSLAALQDLSQARARWGVEADGFLTLFGTKLILPGVADQTTLEAVSTMLGEYDRQVVSHSTPEPRRLRAGTQRTRTRARATPRNAPGCCPRERSRTSPPATACTWTA